MSLDPAIFRALVEQGASPEMLLAVVEAAAAVDEVRLEKKRANNAERQARFRAKNNADNALQPVTERDSVTSPALDKESVPQTPLKEINPTRGGNALPRKAGGFSAPEGVTPETWIAFCQQRKKPLTRIAFNRIVKTLAEGSEAGWPPGEIAERAVERGYETFFLPNEKRYGPRPANDRPDELQNVRVRAAVKLDAERNRGQPNASF